MKVFTTKREKYMLFCNDNLHDYILT
jgi:hypothetical protein